MTSLLGKHMLKWLRGLGAEISKRRGATPPEDPEVTPYRLLNDLGREAIPAVAHLVHPRAATGPPRTPQARSAVTMPGNLMAANDQPGTSGPADSSGSFTTIVRIDPGLASQVLAGLAATRLCVAGATDDWWLCEYAPSELKRLVQAGTGTGILAGSEARRSAKRSIAPDPLRSAWGNIDPVGETTATARTR